MGVSHAYGLCSRVAAEGRQEASVRDLPARSSLILFVADLFHPVSGLAIELLLDSDMCHRRGWRGAVPMFLTWREPDHIPRPNFLNRTAPALCPATASRYDQRLTQRVAMPCCARAGLERHTGADRACGFGRLEQRVNTYRASKILRLSLTGRSRATSFNIHFQQILHHACKSKEANSPPGGIIQHQPLPFVPQKWLRTKSLCSDLV